MKEHIICVKEDKIQNPSTRRWVLKSGSKGKELMKIVCNDSNFKLNDKPKNLLNKKPKQNTKQSKDKSEGNKVSKRITKSKILPDLKYDPDAGYEEDEYGRHLASVDSRECLGCDNDLDDPKMHSSRCNYRQGFYDDMNNPRIKSPPKNNS